MEFIREERQTPTRTAAGYWLQAAAMRAYRQRLLRRAAVDVLLLEREFILGGLGNT